MEKDWAKFHNLYDNDTMGNPVEKATELFEKYYWNRN